MAEIKIYVDGASRGNPGEAAVGIVVLKEGRVVLEHSEYLGQTTNNVAEYKAVQRALEIVKASSDDQIVVCSDSALVVNQLLGRWQIRNSELEKLNSTIQILLSMFSHWPILRKIPRDEVYLRRADELANRILNYGGSCDIRMRRTTTETHSPLS